MSLIRPFFSDPFFQNEWDPFREMQAVMPREMEKQVMPVPQVDIIEHKSEYVVHADVPGVKKEELKLHTEGQFLILEGNREKQTEKKDEHRYYKERVTGSFKRRLRLPVDANADKVTAKLENGVLELVFPKMPAEDVSGRKQIKL